MTELEIEIRDLIVNVLNLEDISPEEITSEEDLFSNEGLALDSIDALEIGVAIQKAYKVKLDSKDEKIAAYFKNIQSIAKMVETRRGE